MDKISKADLAKTIGKRLRGLRTSIFNLGQGEFASKIGISQQALNSYENGRRIPELPILMGFADIFGCSMDYLLGNRENIQRVPITKADSAEYQNLLRSMEQIPSDEVGRFLELFSMLLDALAVHNSNPKRKEFVDSYTELLMQSIIYIAMVNEINDRFTQKAESDSLTAEDVTMVLPQLCRAQGVVNAVEDMEHAGVEVALAFSPKSRKVLNNRRWWKLAPSQTTAEIQEAVSKMLDNLPMEDNTERG